MLIIQLKSLFNYLIVTSAEDNYKEKERTISKTRGNRKNKRQNNTQLDLNQCNPANNFFVINICNYTFILNIFNILINKNVPL
jgi:hypothetical protein